MSIGLFIVRNSRWERSLLCLASSLVCFFYLLNQFQSFNTFHTTNCVWQINTRTYVDINEVCAVRTLNVCACTFAHEFQFDLLVLRFVLLRFCYYAMNSLTLFTPFLSKIKTAEEKETTTKETTVYLCECWKQCVNSNNK